MESVLKCQVERCWDAVVVRMVWNHENRGPRVAFLCEYHIAPYEDLMQTGVLVHVAPADIWGPS